MTHRIDTPTADTNNQFRGGDPQLGIPATRFSPEWCSEQNEDAAVAVEQEGLALVKGTAAAPNAQLPLAIRRAANFGLHNGLRNKIQNGHFQIAQRGASFSNLTAAQYVMDLWRVSPGANGQITVTRQELAGDSTSLPPGIRFYGRFSTNGAATASPNIAQRMSGVEHMAGMVVTAAFRARVASGTIQITPRIRQHFGIGSADGDVVTDAPAVTVGTADPWAVFSGTVTIPSIAGKDIQPGHYMALELVCPSGTAFQLDLARVRICEGPHVVTYSQLPFESMLAFCQRRFQKSYELNTAPGTVTQVGAVFTEESPKNNAFEGLATRITEMRAMPTITWYDPQNSGLAGRINIDGAAAVVTGTLNTSQNSTGRPTISVVGTVVVASAHFTASAEL